MRCTKTPSPSCEGVRRSSLLTRSIRAADLLRVVWPLLAIGYLDESASSALQRVIWLKSIVHDSSV